VVWESRNVAFTDHGGVLSTGGGLVVQGGIDGKLRVYDDATGALLKQIEVGTAMIAAPMSYRIGGVQYIAITAGSGGGGWNVWGPENAAYTRGNANRVLAFRLDGGVTPVPPPLPPVTPIPQPPDALGTAQDVQAGEALFAANCGHCHANRPRAPVPDLRASGLLRDEMAFQSVVLGGALQERGMPRWDDLLTQAEVHRIRAWLISVARQAYDAQRHQGVDRGTAGREGVVAGHL
jgi:quinohemoprotein ethanol dehydrogenase